MKNIFTSAILVCLLTTTSGVSDINAKTLTPEQALARINSRSNPARLKTGDKYHLYHTQLRAGAPMLYLFAKSGNNGFMLLSADDSSAPVLGYSDTGEIPQDATMLPPAFKYWMQSLANQVSYNASNGLSFAPQEIVGEAIAPLTTTRWNQDLPFNYYCPVAGDKHCYTGCVATALAQIMKYHNFPSKGTGTHSYGWKNPTTEQDTTLSFDYGSTTFKWDLMQDKYDKDTPWDDKMAVAELMYACGVAVNMGYGPWSSGAGTNMIGPAMINYFGYDKGVRNYIRDYYGLDEWNRLVYNQLKDFGPVQYSGFGDTDGHSFIIDGYNDEGYFHVNWGWGGMSDGYFLLTALDPLEQGIGGAEQAFDFSQDFVGNVSTGGKSTTVYEQILLENAFGLEQATAKPSEELHIWGGSFNYSVAEISNIMFGAMMISSQRADTLYLTGPERSALAVGDGIRPYDVKLPDVVPAGNYSLVPAFRNSSGVWKQIPVKVGYTNHYDAVSNGETITFSKGAEASVKATDVTAPVKVKLNEKFQVTATLSNDSSQEFFGSVCVALYKPDDTSTVMVKSDAVPVDILAGESQAFDYQAMFAPSDSTLEDGDYLLCVCHVLSGKLTPVSDGVAIELVSDISTDVDPCRQAKGNDREVFFTLTGSRLNGNPTAPGLYLKLIPSIDGVVSRLFIVH